MAKEMIEIEVPEGWEVVNTVTNPPSFVKTPFAMEMILSVQLYKKQPKRRVFEESVTKRKVRKGDMYVNEYGRITFWVHENPSMEVYTILTEIKDENDRSN